MFLRFVLAFFCQICSEICSRFVGEDLRGGDLSNKGKSPAKEEQLEMIEGEEGASTDHDVLFVYIRRRRRTMMVMMTMIKMRMAIQYQSWRSLPSGKWCQKKKDLSPDEINENTCKELTPCILEQKYKNDDKQSEDLKVRVVCDSGAKITN